MRRKMPEDWEATECTDEGCSLSLDDLPGEQILVRSDRPSTGGIDSKRMCDFIWADEQDRAALIELKSGGFDASQVNEKLQRGADLAAEWLTGYGREVRLRPVLAYGGKADKRDMQRLKAGSSSRIRFRKKSLEIKVRKCGDKLQSAL